MRGKVSGDPAFKCLNIEPLGEFGVALAARRATVVTNAVPAAAYPFDRATAPFSVSVPVRRIDWGLEEGRFTADVPECPVAADVPFSGIPDDMKLVPYGATELRLTVFPELSATARR